MNDMTAIAVMVLAVASCTAVTVYVKPPQDDALTACVRSGCTQSDRIECLKAGGKAP